MRRVVVTGMGAVTPLGVGVPALREGLTAGRSGVGRITRFDAGRPRSQVAAEVKGFDPLAVLDKKDLRRMDLFVQYAMAAALEAVGAAGLTLPNGPGDRTAVIVGTGMGGVTKLIEGHEHLGQYGPERPGSHFLPALLPNMAAGWISMRLGARGPNLAVSTACAAGSHAIGEAFRLIQRGQADVAALVNAFAFGGTNAVLALRAADGV